jgi:hypothetical protein
LLEFQYLIGTADGIRHIAEIHRLGLFTRVEYRNAVRAAGLRAFYSRKGITGRGLFIGRKPL